MEIHSRVARGRARKFLTVRSRGACGISSILFAEDLVQKNFGAPGSDAILERMVEVLTHLGGSRTSAGRKPRIQGAAPGLVRAVLPRDGAAP